MSERPSPNFWDNLMVLMKRHGVAQRELSRRTGISTQGIQRWKNGGAPDLESLVKVARALDEQVDALIPGWSRVLRDDAYPSLVAFLESPVAKAASITEEEIGQLCMHRFSTGDPGEAFYYLTFQALRSRAKPAPLSEARALSGASKPK